MKTKKKSKRNINVPSERLTGYKVSMIYFDDVCIYSAEENAAPPVRVYSETGLMRRGVRNGKIIESYT